MQSVQRTARSTFVFAVLFAVFIVAPAFLHRPSRAYALLSSGDILDLFTPLVLIPAYWAMFRLRQDLVPSNREIVGFLVLAALWVQGQGMHLGANAIGHLTKQLPAGAMESLVHDLDEVLSHYLWHLGLVGLAALCIVRQWRHPFVGERSSAKWETGAGLLHGFCYFTTFVEGGTTLVGVPFAVLVALTGLGPGRKHLREQPVLLFFTATCALASLLFLGWAIYWRGMPQFSEVGLL